MGADVGDEVFANGRGTGIGQGRLTAVMVSFALVGGRSLGYKQQACPTGSSTAVRRRNSLGI